MKNKKIRRIFALSAVVLLMASFSVGAWADMYTVKVTVKSGNTLQGICQVNGVDFYKHKGIIMRLNGFTDEKQLDRIKVGDVIEIPASSADAAEMSGTANVKVITEKGTVPVQHNAMASLVSADGSRIPAGDKPAYYISAYTLQNGDNLTDLYGAWGMNASSYYETIKMLNGLSDINYLPAGKNLYLPVSNGNCFGTVYCTVMRHIIAAGETAYEICRSYGLDYNSALPTLTSFNPGMDFNRIKVGASMYIPVGGAASAVPVAQTYTVPTQPTVVPVPVVQPQPVQTPVSSEYDGYGVIVNYGSMLTIRLETTGEDVNLNVTPYVLNGYFPRPGDYVKCNFTPALSILNSIQYVYNVFAAH